MNRTISNINQAITNIMGNDISLFGICQPVVVVEQDGESKYPALVSIDGEAQYVFMDDSFLFGGYHKLINKSFSKVAGQGRKDVDIAIYELVFVFWGFRDKLSLDELSLENKILPAFPASIDLLQTSYDKQSIFNSEFKGFEYLLTPDEILMSIRYKVQERYVRSCLEINV